MLPKAGVDDEVFPKASVEDVLLPKDGVVDCVPKAEVGGFALKAEVERALPNADVGCPNAEVVVPPPKAEGVEPKAGGGFDGAASRDPSENAEAGIDPNGDAPNDPDAAGLLKDVVFPNEDDPEPTPKVDADMLAKLDCCDPRAPKEFPFSVFPLG